MIWALLLSLPVLACAAVLAALLARRDAPGRAPGGETLRFQLVGYPAQRVDEALARLDAQIAANDLRLRGGPEEGAPAESGDETAYEAVAASEETASPTTTVADAAGAADRTRRIDWGTADLVVVAAYVGTALHVLSNLVGKVSTGYLSQGVQDHQAFEWYFGASAHNVATFSNPFFSDRQNFPDGVNLMANAAVTGLGVPFAPITLVLGAHVTFFVVELLGLAGTAAAWYWFLGRRGLVRPAAAVGGWVTGFAPAMVSHANGHPNFVSLFLLPVILDRVLRLAERDRKVRDGVVLGLLVTWQIFIGEEPLLLMAIGVLVVGLVLLAHRRLDVARMAPGVAIGAAVSLVLVAVPLWWQFAGRQSYTSIY
ncbi:MAG: hypothetical protein ACKOVB_20475, partial [Terrabacter sp.]